MLMRLSAIYSRAYPTPHPLDGVIATAWQTVPPLDCADSSFASGAPFLAILKPPTTLESSAIITPRVRVGNADIRNVHVFHALFVGAGRGIRHRLLATDVI